MIDGHKNWAGYFDAGPGSDGWKELEKADVDRPPTWKEAKESATQFNWYWTMRMFWFLFHHKDHGAEAEWLTDSDDRYMDLCQKYKEVHPNETTET